MPKNDIGGFFVSLGMNIDKNSFETGNKLVDGMGNAFNKLIGSARNAAIVLATTAVATGKVESASYKTAAALNITTEALDVWKASAKIAGVNADSLVSSISKIASVQNRIKYDGSGLTALQTQLDKLQMSYAEIKDLSADQATQKILEKAQSMIKGDNAAEIYAYVEDILGAGARDFLIEIVRQNTSVAGMLGKGQATQLTTAADNQKANDFRAEASTLQVELESMSKLFGDSVAGALTDTLKDINKFFQEHGDDIADWIRDAGENVAKLVEKIVGVGQAAAPTIKSAGTVVKDSVTGTFQGTKNIVTGVVEGDKNKIIDGAKQAASATVAPVVSGYNAVKGAIQNKKNGKVNDGIIRPDGTVTQIAPDDWVFAARSIGDMARAFIPQNHTAVSGGEYSIVQNFTINGGNDMPQVLRQQAFMGTKEAMLEMMEESSRRLQLMSATR